MALLSVRFGPITFNDTESYYAAWETIKGLHIDAFRTPVYPIFVGIIKEVVGVAYANTCVMVLQFIIFGISIKYFYLTANMLTRPGLIPFCTTLFYIISPSTMGWGSAILTESLSISLVTMWIYTIVRLWQDGFSLKIASFCSLFLLLIILIRPSFAFVAPICLAYCLFYAFRYRRAAIKVLGFMALPIVILLAYCTIYKSAYGVFTPSYVGTLNQLNILKYSSLDNFDAIPESELSDDLNYGLSHGDYYDFNYLYGKYGLVPLNDAVQKQIANNYKMYLVSCYNNVYSLYYESRIFSYVRSPLNIPLTLIAVINGYSIILIAFAFFVFVILCFFNKDKPYLSTILCLVILGNIVTALLGSHWEHMRLCLTSAPVLILAVGLMASPFRLTRNFQPV